MNKSLRVKLPLLLLLLCLLGGGLFVLAAPPYSIVGVWLVVFLPLYLMWDLLFRGQISGQSGGLSWRVLSCRLGYTWLSVWPVGIIYAIFNAGWATHSAHVFGGLPVFWASLAIWLGVGTAMALMLWLYLAVPFALFWSRGSWWAMPLWLVGIQQLSARLFFWSPGYLMHTTPQLVQSQRWLGSEGLDVVFITGQLWLYLVVRWFFSKGEVRLKPLLITGACWLAALLVLAIDGQQAFRLPTTPAINASNYKDTPAVLSLVGLQPNISLERLAAYPSLLPKANPSNQADLLLASEQALATARNQPNHQQIERPTATAELLVWPESVFREWYFFNRNARQKMQALAARLKVNLVFSTLHAELGKNKSENRYYGSAVHVRPDGTTGQRYDKISLIPFGETIPFANLLPAWGRLVKKIAPRISQFEAGKTHTVFELDRQVRLAPLICFDIVHRGVALRMAKAGANVGVVMANLAWFGQRGASRQMEFITRMRAIAAGIPIAHLAQGGESMVVDAQGRHLTMPLPTYTAGVLHTRIQLPQRASFYARHQLWWQRGLLLAWLLLLFGWWRKERLASGKQVVRSWYDLKRLWNRLWERLWKRLWERLWERRGRA